MSKFTQWIIATLIIFSTTLTHAFNTSYYGPGFHGNLTASGIRYNQHGISVAHKTLPFGTIVKITNIKNKKSVVAAVTDRGPYIRGRIFDLSAGANKVLDCNLCTTSYEVLKIGDGKYHHPNKKVKQDDQFVDPPAKAIPVKYKQAKPNSGLLKLNRT